MYRIKFEADGNEVETADNGKLGLQLIEDMNPDIVLLDLMMPIMDGPEMLTALRKKSWGKDIKVIILTNVGESEAPDSVKEQNIEAFIIKINFLN